MVKDVDLDRVDARTEEFKAGKGGEGGGSFGEEGLEFGEAEDKAELAGEGVGDFEEGPEEGSGLEEWAQGREEVSATDNEEEIRLLHCG